MVSDMISVWFHLRLAMRVKILFWSQPTGTISKIASKVYLKPYQNDSKIILYQRHKNHREIAQKTMSLGCFCFLLWKPALKPAYRNHITNVSKTIPKSFRNHKNHPKIDQKQCPWLYLLPCFEANLPEPYQNRFRLVSNQIKIITKLYRNQIQSVADSYLPIVSKSFLSQKKKIWGS